MLDGICTTGYPNARVCTVRDVAQFLKVLADEARLQILWLLSNHEELCVCDIMGALGITQSKASRHLATLRHAGLVVDRREGPWSYYTLRPAGNDAAGRYLEVLRSVLGQREDAALLLRKLRRVLGAKSRGEGCAWTVKQEPAPVRLRGRGNDGRRPGLARSNRRSTSHADRV